MAGYVLWQTAPNPMWLLPPGRWKSGFFHQDNRTDGKVILNVSVKFKDSYYRYLYLGPAKNNDNTNPTLNDHGPKLNEYFKNNKAALDARTS